MSTGACAASSSAASQSQPRPPAPSDQKFERRSFTPRDIDHSKCMARTWGNGAGAQCANRPAEACNGLCLRHFKQQDSPGWHGRVDGPIPESKLKEFQRASNRKPPRVGEAAETARSGSEVRQVPVLRAAEPREAPPATTIVDRCVLHTRAAANAASEARARPAELRNEGSDGGGGAPPAKTIVDERIVSTRAAAAAPGGPADPDARRRTRRDSGADGTGVAPPAMSIVDGCVFLTRAGAAAASEVRARPEARPRIATLDIPDVASHEAAQAAMEGQTERRRREDFARGRVTGFSGDIPRSDPSRWG